MHIKKKAGKGLLAVVFAAALAAVGVGIATAGPNYIADLDSGYETSDSAPASATIRWNDNMSSDRPAVDEWEELGATPHYYYSLDNGDYVEVTAAELAVLGVEPALTTPEVNPDKMSWTIKSDDLPTQLTWSDEEGEPTKTSTLSWKIVFEQSQNDINSAGYVVPADTVDEQLADGYVGVTYTQLSDYMASIVWKDNNGQYNTRPDFTQGGMKLYRYVQGQPDDAEEIDSSSISISDAGVVKLANLPEYDEDGDPYVYYIAFNDDYKIIVDEEGNTNGDSYHSEIINDNAYAGEADTLYSEGKATLTLTGNTGFEVEKTWTDGEGKNRPSCTLWIYRIAENDEGSMAADDIEKAAPVPNNDKATVPGEDGAIEVGTAGDYGSLPKYDADGHRYIYFGYETGLTGDYACVVDNKDNVYTDTIEGIFDNIKKGGQVKYVLNGGAMDNKLTGTKTEQVTKTYVAAAVYSEGLQSKMKLQIKDKDGNWIDATESNIPAGQVGKNDLSVEDGKVIATLKGFTEEQPSQTFSGLTVNKYDEEGYPLTYRWVEYAVKAGGNDWATGITYNEDKERYEVNAGKAADGTDILFKVSTGSDGNVTNTLIGKRELAVEKKWYKDGVNVSSDEGLMEAVYIAVQIYRDGVIFGDPVILNINDLASDNQRWLKVIEDVDRYDENGKEYTFTAEEKETVDPKGNRWSTEMTGYTEKIVVSDDGISVPQLTSHFVNTIGEGEGLTIDVYKEWLDGSDISSRKEVVVDIRNINSGNTVASATLEAEENWYKRIGFAKADDEDTVDNYVAVERTIGSGDAGVAVNYGDHTPEDLFMAAGANSWQNGKCSYSSDFIVGEIASNSANGLSYNYNVILSKERGQSQGFASYHIVNIRKATLNLDLVKSWKAGGKQPAGTFVVTRTDEDGGNEKTICTFDLPSDELPDGVTAVERSDGKCEVKINGLAKYAQDGSQYVYSINETKIGGKSLSGGSVTIDGDKYVGSMSLSKVDIKGASAHHDGDQYDYAATNSRSDSFTMDVNKVWRDEGTSGYSDRPDVYFNMYRFSLSDAKIAELTDDSGKIDRDALARLAASKMGGTAEKLGLDYFWDTSHNDWYWSCNVGSMPRYDGNGNRYIYFLIEKTSGNSAYTKGYSNGAEQPKDKKADGSAVTSTRDVFTDMDLSDNVLLLADGIKGDVFSRTTVNTHENTRTYLGKKVWKVPAGTTVDLSLMPEVGVDLYRADNSKTYDFPRATSYNNADLEQAIEAGALIKVTDEPIVLNNGNNYAFRQAGLDRYDEYGQVITYYAYEVSDVDAYPNCGFVSTAGTFTMTNSYSTETSSNPRVKVSVSKEWESLIASVGVDKLVDVKFQLWAQADGVSMNGGAAGEPILMGTAILKANSEGKANFTFEYVSGSEDANAASFNKQGKAYLSYFSPNGRPYKYYVTEKFNDSTTLNGYAVTAPESGISKDKPVTLSRDSASTATDVIYSGTVGAYTNKYEAGKTNFTAYKRWVESNNMNLDLTGYRPSSVTVTVSRSWSAATINGKSMPAGSENYTTVVLNSANSWSQQLTNLDKYAPNGSAYTYYVSAETFDNDTLVKKLYNSAKAKTSVNNDTFKNTLNVVSLTAKKSWATDEDSTLNAAELQKLIDMGYLPSKLTFELERKTTGNFTTVTNKDGNAVKKEFTTASAMFGASWTVSNVPKYDTAGNLYTYRIKETFGNITIYSDATAAVTGQVINGSEFMGETATVTKSGSTYTFKNTLDYIKMYLVKEWNDHDNQDNTRPDSVSFKIDEGDVKYGDYTINKPASGNTSGVYTVYVPNPAAGQTLQGIYTVTEPNAPAANNVKDASGQQVYYSKSATAWSKSTATVSMNDTATITNTYEPDPNQKHTSIKATKTFAGEGSWADVTRSSITFQLQYKDRSDNAWKDVTDTNKVSMFGMAEDAPVSYAIGADKEKSTQEVTFGDMWRYWTDPTTDGVPQLIEYRVKETVAVADGGTNPYTTSETQPTAQETGTYTAAITNTTKLGTLKVRKIWKATKNGEEHVVTDASEFSKLISDKAIPATLYFKLQAKVNGAWTDRGDVKSYGSDKLVNAVTFTNSAAVNNDKYPQYDSEGKAIEYRIVECSEDGNTIYSGKTDTVIGGVTYGTASDDVEVKTVGNDITSVTTNSVQTAALSVEKAWNDDNERDGAHATTISVTLKRDGNAYDTVSLTGDMKKTWEMLPVMNNDGSAKSVWTVEENTSLAGYTVTYSPGKDQGSAAQGIELNDKDNAAKFTITNTHEPSKTSVKVTKQWNDGNDVKGKRPTQITVQLYKKVGNGQPEAVEGKTATLNAANNWSHTWSGLFVNEPKAQHITYSVQETGVNADDYKVEYVTGQGGEYDLLIKNTVKASLTINKVWLDGGVNRPGSISCVLYANGSKVQDVTLTAANNWTTTVDKLLVYDGNGTPINYTVSESMTGYTTVITYSKVPEGRESGVYIADVTPAPKATITNTLIDQPKVSLTASKSFTQDADFASFTRPTVTYDLYYQPEDGDDGDWVQMDDSNKATFGYTGATSQTVTIGSDGAGSVVFEGLLRYWPDKEQVKIEYQICERLNGTADMNIDDSAYTGYVGSNTATVADTTGLGDTGTYELGVENRMTKKTEIKVAKSWKIAGSGSAVDKTTAQKLLNDGYLPTALNFKVQYSSNGGDSWNDWQTVSKSTSDLINGSQKIGDLPTKDANGNDLTWRALEVAADGSDLSGTTVGGIKYDAATVSADGTISFTNQLITGSLVIEKTWGTGDKPQSVDVKISSSDNNYSDTVTLNAGNSWTVTVDNLKVYQKLSDTKVTYSIQELGIDTDVYTVYYTPDPAQVTLEGDASVKLAVRNVETDRVKNEVTVTATKAFAEDVAWASLTRPSVSFQLYYKSEDGTWAKAADNDSSIGLTGESCKTVNFGSATSGTVKWDKLKRYWTTGEDHEGTGALIEYKVEELLNNGSLAIANSSYSPEDKLVATPAAKGDYVLSATNTLNTAPVSLMKKWTLAGSSLASATVAKYIQLGMIPETMDIALQYKKVGGYWTTWTVKNFKTIDLLTEQEYMEVPAKDSNGNAISWRFVEVNADGESLAGARVLMCMYGEAAQVELNSSAILANKVMIASLEVSKTWDDADDVSVKRPTTITVNIVRDGDTEHYYKTIELNADNKWKATIDNLPVCQDGSAEKSVYTVIEEVPTSLGYSVKYEHNENIVLTSGQKSSTSMENYLDMDNIVLAKTAYVNETCSTNEEISASETRPLAGAVFEIYSTKTGKLIQTSESDEEGKVSFKRLPEGTYKIIEVSAPSPFVVNDSEFFAKIGSDGKFIGLYDADDEPVDNDTIVNDQVRADVSLLKVGAEDATKVLEGAEFTLYRVAEEAVEPEPEPEPEPGLVPLDNEGAEPAEGEEEPAADEPADIQVASATTGEDGKITFEGLLTGVTYKLIETVAPKGYYLSANPITFKLAVDENGVAQLEAFDGGEGTAEMDGDTLQITWKDVPTIASIKKVDEQGKALPGASLKLTNSAGEVIDTWTSGNAPHVITAKLLVGETYTLTELSAPEGYVVADPISFLVEEKVVAPSDDVAIDVTMVDPMKKSDGSGDSEDDDDSDDDPGKTDVVPVNGGGNGGGGYSKTGASTFPLYALAFGLIICGLGLSGIGLRRRNQAPRGKHSVR